MRAYSLTSALLFVAVSARLSAQPCASVPPGLVSWWPGDGNTNDIVGGFNGALEGAASYATGEVGQGFSLPAPGLNGFVNIPYASNPTTPFITVAAWVNPATIQAGASAVNRRPGANDVGYTLEQRFTGDGTVLWNVFINGTSVSVVSSAVLSTNTWTHLAGTYDGTTSRLYVNGVESGSMTVAGTIDPIAADVQIGRNIANGNLWGGGIDEVQVWNRALSAAELQSIVNAGSGGNCKMFPKPMSVDGHAAPGTSSNLNGVLEPGETVLVAPSWQNEFVSSISLTGTASDLTGPSGPTYTLDASAADYGTVASAATSDCFSATQNCYLMKISGVRPVQHWDATFTESLAGFSNSILKTWTLHVGESFPDVPTSNTFYDYVENLFHNGITGGCAGGNYCPTNSVTRAQMAVFLLKGEHGSTYVPPTCMGVFGDVPCPSQFADWIEQLAVEGITGGCGGGDYCPSSPVTRAQMAVFLLKGEHGSSYVPPACTGVFGDVTCPSQFADWIERLAAEGITGGCGSGDYCPGNPATRGQMAVFLVKAFALQLYGP